MYYFAGLDTKCSEILLNSAQLEMVGEQKES